LMSFKKKEDRFFEEKKKKRKEVALGIMGSTQTTIISVVGGLEDKRKGRGVIDSVGGGVPSWKGM